MSFRNRAEAGRRLAARLNEYRGSESVVLGLPRGGVDVAFEVARALRLPLDVLVVRKLGAPGQRELGMGAIAEGGARYLDPKIVAEVGATAEDIEEIEAIELVELERRVRRWRGAHPAVPVEGKTAIVVDDGIATGGSVRAALRALRAKRPDRVVLAVPVAPVSTLDALAAEGDVDEIVCVVPAEFLWAIGEWYDDFEQVSDERVAELLERARATMGVAVGRDAP